MNEKGNRLALRWIVVMIFGMVVSTVSTSEGAQPTGAHPAAFSVKVEATSMGGQPGPPNGPLELAHPCPITVKFTASIASPKAGDVKYHVVRSDGGKGPQTVVKFDKPGTKAVTATWKSNANYSGWLAFDIDAPVKMQSNKAEFKVICTAEEKSAPQAKGPAAPAQRGARAHVAAASKTAVTTPAAPPVKQSASQSGSSGGTQCLPVNADSLEAADFKGKIAVIDKSSGRAIAMPFGSGAQAKMGADALKSMGVDEICYTGPGSPAFITYRKGGQAVSGSTARCTPFDPAALTVVKEKAYKIMNGGKPFIIVGGDKDAAQRAQNILAILQGYGYNKRCEQASMTFFRK